MDNVKNRFGLSMNRVLIIHALAEASGKNEIVEYIENQSGDLITEHELERVETEILSHISDLRADDCWPQN